MESTIEIIQCCVLLHNFIRFHDRSDIPPDDVIEEEVDNVEEADIEAVTLDDGYIAPANGIKNQWRNAIANSMWKDYLQHIQNNNNNI